VLRTLIAGIVLIVSSVIGGGDFWLGWDNPVRGCVGVPIDSRYTYFEVKNRPLSWSLKPQCKDELPQGLAIDQTGRVTWPSPIAGTYKLTTTVTRPDCDELRYPGCVRSISRDFTLTVGTADCLFVSTTGNDASGTGAPAAPYRTVLKALQQITSADGKAIYLRGGEYAERWQWTNSSAPDYTGRYPGAVSGVKDFTEADYLEVRSFPGEHAIIRSTGTYDSSRGHGLYFTSDVAHVVVSNLEVAGATMDESANLFTNAPHTIFKDIVTHNANWSGSSNCSGIRIESQDDAIVDRVTSYENRYVSGGQGVVNPGNQANFMVLHDLPDAPGTTWLLNIKGWGSFAGVYLKHASVPGSRTVIQNAELFGGIDPQSPCVMGAETGGSFRYGVCLDTFLWHGRTDPSNGTAGRMSFEHLTVIPASGNPAAYSIQTDSYGKEEPGAYLRQNIFYQRTGPSDLFGDGVRRMFHLWEYFSPPTVRRYPFDSDYNLFWNTAGLENSWLVGGGKAETLGFAEYQKLTGTGITRDPHSQLRDPGFANIGAGNLMLAATSPAASCGDGYCGAFRPGAVYGPVGEKTAALLNFEVESPSPCDLRLAAVEKRLDEAERLLTAYGFKAGVP
jgi:hypothetical protein